MTLTTMTTVTTGITDVATVLQHLGVTIKRVGDKEISGCCPVHENRTGKSDNSPSWSMNAYTGLWICYSCGARGTLSSLVSELSGEPDSIVAVHQFLVSSGLNRLTNPKEEIKHTFVDWQEFLKFEAPTDNRLNTRTLNRDSARKYGLRFDRGSQSWILPIVNQFGELMGWQEKSMSKVRNYPVGVKKSETLFGIDRVSTKVGVLVESPLDVARLDSVMSDVSGVASFGAHVSKTQIGLLVEHFDSLIIALDNDDAGVTSSKKLMKSLPSFRNGIKLLSYAHTNAKDIGDMTNAEIITAVSNASYFPWWSRV